MEDYIFKYNKLLERCCINCVFVVVCEECNTSIIIDATSLFLRISCTHFILKPNYYFLKYINKSVVTT